MRNAETNSLVQEDLELFKVETVVSVAVSQGDYSLGRYCAPFHKLSELPEVSSGSIVGDTVFMMRHPA